MQRERGRWFGWQASHSRLAAGLFAGVLLLVNLPAGAKAGPSVPPAESTRVAASSLVASPADAGGLSPVAVALEREAASAEVRYVADWVAQTRDNGSMPYVIIDKVDARVYVFDADGALQGTAAALLGMVPGDGSAAGVGDRALAAIRPNERTTPAGRFVASLGPDLHGQDILWVDYDTALALHRVAKGTPAEGRSQRLLSPSPEDNRISYGCINVPVAFYESVVGPAFKQTSGVVYILPELSPARDLFKPGVASPK